ncbi:MAG TPA: hypothetical protein VFB96_04320 [Pirellulaceae bacterium]|nr:hypothetical protein [Pirellulaceae bacterium]
MRQKCNHDGPQPICGGGPLAMWKLEDIQTEEIENAHLDDRIVTSGLQTEFGGEWLTQVWTPPNPVKAGKERGRADGVKVVIDGDKLRIEIVEIKSCSKEGGGCSRATDEAKGYQSVLGPLFINIAMISQALNPPAQSTGESATSPKNQKSLKAQGIDLNNKDNSQALKFLNSLEDKRGRPFGTAFRKVEFELNKDGAVGQIYRAGAPIKVECTERGGEKGFKARQLVFQTNQQGGISYRCENTGCGKDPNPKVPAPPAAPATGETTEAAPTTEPFTLRYDKKSVDVQVPSGWLTAKKAEAVKLAEPASALIPGFVLQSLQRQRGGKIGISGQIDDRPEVLPVSLKDKAGGSVRFTVDGQGNVKLTQEHKNKAIAIDFPRLSPGMITKLESGPEGVEFSGWINPKVPLLGRLGIEYSKGALTVVKGLDEAALKKRRVLGMRVTKAQVEMQLAPEFKPRGVIELQMGSEKDPLATATLTLEADSVGLIATGKLKVNIPKMETSETTITYKGGGDRNEWLAAIHIKSENIKLGAGFSVTGELTGSIEKEKIDFDGKLDIGLPGDNSAQLGLRRGPKGEWVLYGSGSFKVPKIDRVRATVLYELEKDILTATVETPTGFKIPAIDLTGKLVKLTVTIAKGRKITATGTGRLDFKKGKAEGSATVTYTPEGKFIGTGSLSYALTPNLTITGTVELDKDERLRVTGQLTFKKLTILDKIEDKRNLIDLRYPIPIPGASIGGIGLEAVLGAKLDAGFSFGAVVIEPLTFEAGFNPLEDDPNLDLAVWGTVKIPASAFLSASISGGIQLDVFIAEVGGEIILTGTISLEGGIFIPFKGRYAKKKFTAELTPEVKLGLMLAIALSARVWAKAGIGWLSVKTEKTWKLGEKKVDTGLKFGVKAPISYDSETGIKMPSLSQVELIKPDFSKENLMRVAERIFSDAPATEREV